MNRYVSEFLDTVPTVRDYVSASPLLRNVYVLTIVRKFFFFLDPLGTGITDHPAHVHRYRPSTYGFNPTFLLRPRVQGPSVFALSS